LAHGAQDLPEVRVDSYNEDIREEVGFLGDRASKRAFTHILDEWRERLRRLDDDPFGDQPTHEISKKKLDKVLAEGDTEAAGLVHSAVEEFANELATVLRRFLKLKSWRETERVVVGGGLRDSRVGELAIGRAAVLLKSDGIDTDLVPIRHHPDEAGLIGAAHLVPSWMMSGHQAILAVDIGGTNMRAGIVAVAPEEDPDLAKAKAVQLELWRHRDEKPSRDEAMDRLVGMLKRLVKHAGKEKLKLAPFIGVGCPGLIRADGVIERGAQNLPGNWESSRFHLAERLCEGVGKLGDHDPTVLVHNDAVVQGLSQLPFMRDVERWGVLTIGTGLGNARFSNRRREKE
jgi:predicted NBD/HSP70 family sugar kinase